MKKSIKKHIKVGNLIRLPEGPFYVVTELKKNTFVCIMQNDPWGEPGITQELYYNVDMMVYNVVDSNF